MSWLLFLFSIIILTASQAPEGHLLQYQFPNGPFAMDITLINLAHNRSIEVRLNLTKPDECRRICVLGFPKDIFAFPKSKHIFALVTWEVENRKYKAQLFVFRYNEERIEFVRALNPGPQGMVYSDVWITYSRESEQVFMTTDNGRQITVSEVNQNTGELTKLFDYNPEPPVHLGYHLRYHEINKKWYSVGGFDMMVQVDHNGVVLRRNLPELRIEGRTWFEIRTQIDSKNGNFYILHHLGANGVIYMHLFEVMLTPDRFPNTPLKNMTSILTGKPESMHVFIVDNDYLMLKSRDSPVLSIWHWPSQRRVYQSAFPGFKEFSAFHFIKP
jgi:hypothetical protein